MVDTVNSSTTNILVQFVLLNDAAQVRSLANPVAFLDDAAVHIDDVQASVGASRTIDGTEVRVGSSDEFFLVISIGNDDPAIVIGNFGSAHQAANRLGNDQVAVEIRRHAVTTIDRLATTSCESVQRIVVANSAAAALDIRHRVDRKNVAKAGRLFASQ